MASPAKIGGAYIRFCCQLYLKVIANTTYRVKVVVHPCSLSGVVTQSEGLDDELSLLQVRLGRQRLLLDAEGLVGDSVCGTLIEDPDTSGFRYRHICLINSQELKRNTKQKMCRLCIVPAMMSSVNLASALSLFIRFISPGICLGSLCDGLHGQTVMEVEQRTWRGVCIGKGPRSPSRETRRQMKALGRCDDAYT